MTHKIFGTIVNTIQDKIVSISGQKMYFNSWTEQGSCKNTFCRNTKLTLQRVFWLIVSRIVQSLPISLASFFDQLSLQIPSKGAFSMKRRLIKSELFEDVNKAIVSELYSPEHHMKTWKGYVVLACDGSRIALPNVAELGETFGYYHTSQGEILYPCAKAAIFQDTLNNVTVLAKLVDKNMDERYTFEENYMEANSLVGGKSIMTIDRGYFSYLLMYLMIKSNQLFVMKAREAPWRTDFISSGKKEGVIEITPSRSASIYANEQWRQESEKKIKVRLVRFGHPDGSVDVLVTNIFDRGMASYKDIITLYRLRWPAETAYGIYKNDMALELFSTFRKDGILQDFHAAIIMYNLASILASDCKRPPKDKKINMNIAVGIIHDMCPVLSLEKMDKTVAKRIRTDTRYLSHCLTEIKPNRSFSRIRRSRKTSGKFYRHTNFAMAV